MDIAEVFAAYQNEMRQVESHLDRYITSDVKLIPDVAHHLIDSGGKRFRPLLLLISARLCGYAGEHRFPLAAAIEFIHTASLLHDDVIDEAVLRRGRTSANNVWGNAASVLVGDFLYSKAFNLLAEIGDIRIVQLMSKMTNIMSEGEVFQLMKCGDTSLTEAEYLSIVEKKTAVLISAACETAPSWAAHRQNRWKRSNNTATRSAWRFRLRMTHSITWPGKRISAKPSARIWKKAK